MRLTTLHNLHFYLNLLARARRALESGTFPELREEIAAGYPPKTAEKGPASA